MRIPTLALAAILCLCGPSWAASPGNPAELPAILQKSIDSKNSGLALQHLDLERIITNVFDETLPQINDSVLKGEILLSPPLAAALGSLNSGNNVTRRTASIFLTSEVSKLLVYGVESGSFAGDPLPKNDRMIMDGGIFSKFGDVSMARKEFHDTRLLRNDENTALVQTSLYDHDLGRDYALQLRLEQIDGLWKVVSIENAADLYRELVRQN